MSGRAVAAVPAGALLAAVVIAPAALAHAAAGGSVEPSALLLPTLVAGGVGALSARRVRWTFPRLALLTTLAQPILHRSLGAAHTTDRHVGHAQHHGHDTVAVAAHADGRMVAAHLVVALGTAMAMRWGVRWLRSLPSLVCALLVPVRYRLRPVSLAVPCRSSVAPALLDQVALGAVGSRGPPW